MKSFWAQESYNSKHYSSLSSCLQRLKPQIASPNNWHSSATISTSQNASLQHTLLTSFWKQRGLAQWTYLFESYLRGSSRHFTDIVGLVNDNDFHKAVDENTPHKSKLQKPQSSFSDLNHFWSLIQHLLIKPIAKSRHDRVYWQYKHTLNASSCRECLSLKCRKWGFLLFLYHICHRVQVRIQMIQGIIKEINNLQCILFAHDTSTSWKKHQKHLNQPFHERLVPC